MSKFKGKEDLSKKNQMYASLIDGTYYPSSNTGKDDELMSATITKDLSKRYLEKGIEISKSIN